ncbi:DgyrCDS10667 [Dimorphilus gyrociliatus]|uniref:DgyrCDS10667 n=1 Tax=Dimorphilus gyrociliatus TaxID=2664684 RepID=A0A7I8W2A3_9ANNE|nr:DgyrCDS10667 [Dimorphilus gyrociliatus]
MLDKDCEETANVHTCKEGYELVFTFMKERRCWMNNCRKCPEIEIGCSFGPLTFEKNTCKPKCKPNPCDVANCPPGYGCRLSYRTQNGIREYYSRCYERERVCFQPHTKDDCGKNITRYYYNDDVKDCLPFIDTGCGKSENNHVSLQSCRKSCYGYRCKLFRCRSCPHGYKYDEKDCQTCECLKEPMPYKCLKFKCTPCPNGYKIDKNGCQTCECLKKPKPFECPMFKCIPCSHGYKIDENGCQTCECLPSHRICPMVNCLPCDFSYEKDKYGCQTCRCVKPTKAICEYKKFFPWISHKVLTKWGLIGLIIGSCAITIVFLIAVVLIIKMAKRKRSVRKEVEKTESVSSGKYKCLKDEMKVPLA